MPLPIEIIGLGKSEVTLVWDEGHEAVFPARDLRLRCGCAHCVEEMTGRPLLDPGSVSQDVRVARMELIGAYGVQIEFTDGHGTGIFRFADLAECCPCAACEDQRASLARS